MRLGTLRSPSLGTTVAVRIDDDDVAVEIPGFADVGALLAVEGWRTVARGADGPRHDAVEAGSWAPPVLRPSKIVCVGLNYRNHILEMGRELPEYPTLFAKFPEALVGPFDPIVLPAHASDAVDWEAEVAVVIGATARRVPEHEAGAVIAGFAVLNDVTMRDYQYRTTQWFQGKTFEATTPFGPWLTVSEDGTPPGGASEMRTEIDGEVMQRTPVDDMVFGPAALVSYVSHVITLHPGDVIATGTPGGVGHARTPARYLEPGQVLVTSVSGLGELRNEIVAED
ncbi:MAG: fumarylacetoacetate hydrolase family protein [Actinomycetota bacterium]|nr:fumarylacetoacetate hydrolase family protein [Actinomycetota bacterium]